MNFVKSEYSVRFQGRYTIGQGIEEQNGPKTYKQVKKIFEKRKNQYPDSLEIFINAQNGFQKEGRISYIGKGEPKSREFSLRKIPIFGCLPVPVGPPLETSVQFAKRLVREAKKLVKEWKISSDSPQS